MGIRNRIKKVVLPIIGRGGSDKPTPPARPRPAPAAQRFEEEEEEEQTLRGDMSAADWIAKVVAENQVVLFMKGNPQAPQCGFSAASAGILSSTGRPFMHVNVLADPEIRSGVKQFSSWPTIPQIYIGGEFVGGSDILREMVGNGELEEALAEAFADADAEG